jgi:hypothetical protein
MKHNFYYIIFICALLIACLLLVGCFPSPNITITGPMQQQQYPSPQNTEQGRTTLNCKCIKD